MDERLVTRDQKNALFAFAVEIGLNPEEFTWEKRPSRNDSKLLVSAIVHLLTGSYFVFDFGSARYQRRSRGGFTQLTEHKVECSPGDNTSPEVRQCKMGEQPLRFALDWLLRVKRELETPDLWEKTPIAVIFPGTVDVHTAIQTSRIEV
ncbi:MAG TPA: hypothetical protein VI837_14980 [Blastocatellia bacterium]|nr:hypothetical protein [Blastocatellia bacterium]